MIKYNKAFLEYKANKYGTERVLLNNESSIESCTPTLDINYPNTQQTDLLFIYRPTGGSDNILSGLAQLNEVGGNSVKFNQLVQNGNFSDGVNHWWPLAGSATISVSDRILTVTKTSNDYGGQAAQEIPINTSHKYYIAATAKTQNSDTFVSVGFAAISGATGGNSQAITASTEFTHVSLIATPLNNTDVVVFRVGQSTTPTGSVGYLKNMVALDLTAMGIDNLTTVEQVEAWLEANMGKKDYYPYTDNKVVNVTSSTIESIGFNQWDEEWVNRQIDAHGEYNDTKRVSAKNFIPILPNKDYCITVFGKGGVSDLLDLFFYDENKTFISYVTPTVATPFTPPANARYMKFSLYYWYGSSDGNTYNNDICINISNASRNGTYEPYDKSTLDLDSTRLYGKKNGTGNLVQIWPTGMPGIDDLKDLLYLEDGAVVAKRFWGEVDFGQITDWLLLSNNTFRTYQVPFKGYSSYLTPCIHAKYKQDTSSYLNLDDKCFVMRNDIKVFVRDTSCVDAATFKTANNGVMLYFELATPEIYTELAYDNSQAGDGSELVPFGVLQKRYIGNNPVGRVYKGTNLLWETNEGYGVRWEHDGGSVTITRIGNEEYHKTLPIQSQMKRCILKSNGDVQYISDTDYTKDTEGNTIDYTAANQDIMVEIPEHYYEAGQVTENGVVYDYIMLYPTVHLGKKVPKHYIGAFEAMTYNGDNNTPQSLWSTCKTNITYEQDGSVDLGSLTYSSDAAQYRGGNRDSSSYGDATDKSLLGKPATNITIGNFATYGKARGNGYAMINWASWNVVYRLYVVEYANFNSQATFNGSLTSAGYHQGGLGDGVTNANGTNWSNELGYNPYIPCGVTLKLGSNTGTVKCTLPSSIQNISTNTYVPSYRGVENPFGHIWQITSGISIYGYNNVNYIFTDNLGIYTRDFTTISSTTAPSGFTLKSSTTPLSGGYASQIEFDESGEFVPKTVSSTSMFSDYFYGNNTGAKRLLLGGCSFNGSIAGLFYFGCSDAVGRAYASYGSRLLYIGNN